MELPQGKRAIYKATYAPISIAVLFERHAPFHKAAAVQSFAPTTAELEALGGGRPAPASPPTAVNPNVLSAVRRYLAQNSTDRVALAQELRDVASVEIASFGRALANLRAARPNDGADTSPPLRGPGLVARPLSARAGAALAPASDQATSALVAAFEQSVNISPVGYFHLERLDMIPADVERGELIGNAVLGPSETVTIFHKEWSTVEQDFQSIVTDSLENYSETGVTENSELSRSTESQSKHSSSLDLSAQASGKFPFVTVSTNSSIQLATSNQQSEKDSRNHSHQETRKASLRSKREHKITVGTISTVGREDTTSRTITNPSNSSGLRVDYYSLLRKWHVQLYRYDVRMTYDIVIPEPGAAMRVLYQKVEELNAKLAKPFSFRADDQHIIIPEELDPSIRSIYESRFGVALDTPPSMTKVGLVTDSHIPGDNPINSILPWSFGFDVPEGYQVVGAALDAVLGHFDYGDRMFKFLGGPDDLLSNLPGRQGGNLHLEMTWLHGYTGHIDLSYVTRKMDMIDVGITFTCGVLPGPMHEWQVASWNKLHQAALEEYNRNFQQIQAERDALNAQILAGDTLTLRRQENEEIMKAVMRWMFGPKFQVVPSQIVALAPAPTEPGGLTSIDDPALLPGGDNAWNDVLHYGEIIKFMHEAVEWENVTYFLYPYFWDVPANWEAAKRLSHPDPLRQAFLRAGSARVVLTIKPGFETAFATLMEQGAFGADLPSDHPYISIAQEVQDYAKTNYPGIPPANADGPPPIDNPGEAGILIAEWFEYTPTSAIDIQTTFTPAAGTPPTSTTHNGSVVAKTVDLTTLTTGDVVARFVPGFAGTLAGLAFEADIPATTAGRVVTLSAYVAGVKTVGGELMLTSANTTPKGHTVPSTPLVGGVSFDATQELTVVASNVTAFKEGAGTLYLYLH
jgi:hypothetical protein